MVFPTLCTVDANIVQLTNENIALLYYSYSLSILFQKHH